MLQPYQLLADNWEGRPAANWNIPLLKANGISGSIVRLNDMSGGHHMDAEFDANWKAAGMFDARTIYFVYNPWVSGAQNYDWMAAHLPNDTPRRLCIDIEVRKPDYPAATYAQEVNKFLGKMDAGGWWSAIYTGAWFLPNLSAWPTNREYWWAAYSLALMACKTWESYKATLNGLNYTNWTKSAPGRASLWQCTGDKTIMPGFGGRDVDINVFPGSLDDLKAWIGMPASTPPPPTEPPSLQEQIDALRQRIEKLEKALEK